MKNQLLTILLVLASLFSISQDLHHDINVTLDIPNGEISAVDNIKLTRSKLENKDYIEFNINGNLTVKSLDKSFTIEQISNSEEKTSVPVKSYKISLAGKENTVSIPLQIKGVINDQIKEGAAEYARGFSTTTGIIFEDGVYLAGSTYWIPSIENLELFTFDLTVNVPEKWNVVSQGTRITNEVKEGKRTVKYNSPDPMDEIYLIANNWTEYSLQAGKVLVQAFLRTPDEELATRYLGVTAQYLKLYEDIIGPYPFTKFALVENFWETGFGMPSFTLLGEKVIRFPWILNSSYPHELLHNYWGNSVFVNYEKGNWCEGITAYMADHLIKEQSGEASEYRRTTLQKFTDYVNPENDFPIVEFISRNNSAEEAIGYGKSLMFNDMLRDYVGDDLFLQAYTKFYNDNKFRKASFDDLRICFESVSNKDLNSFFKQWLERTGAPTLKLENVSVKENKNQFALSFNLSQVQPEDLFNIDIPIVIYLEGLEKVVYEKINMSERNQKYTFNYTNRPQRIDIDPQFNIIRRLDKKEVSSSLSQVFGSTQGIIILPSDSKHIDAYKGLADMWQKSQAAQGKEIKIIRDSDIELLPSEKALWVLGFENKFADQVSISKEYGNYFTDEIKNSMSKLQKEGALVYAINNPVNSDFTLGFVGANSDESITALSRKLLHYGKYGYLGFEGETANNILKGSLPAINSPLNYTISINGKLPIITTKIEPRKALSENR